jgi:hypothetical protein
VESLVLVVAIIIYGLLLSGPLSLALSSRRAKRLTEQLALKIMRRIVMGLINFFGISLSVFFVTGPFPIGHKIISVNLITIHKSGTTSRIIRARAQRFLMAKMNN